MKKTALIFFLSLTLSAAGAVAGQWWIPAAAHANGAEDSVWRTDLIIHNFSAETQSLSIYLLPQNRDNSALSRRRDYSLQPGSTLSLEDLLDSEFTFNGTAALRIDSTGDQLAISSRTYNLGTLGSYGQTIPAVRTEEILEGQAYRLLGVGATEGRRSNVGWVNLDGKANNVSIYLFNEAGELLNSKSYSSAPYSQQQLNDVFSSLSVEPIESGWIRVFSSGRLATYASVVAAGSNDPIYISPSRMIDASPELMVPAAAHVQGVGGTQWKTDVWVMNVGSEPTTPSFELWPQTGGDPITVSVSDPIVPGQLLNIRDVVSSLFSSTNLQGALILSAEASLLATSRTYNTAPEGSFGQFIPAQPTQSLPGAGDSLLLEGVVADEAFRTNIGFVSTADDALVTMTLKNATGTIIATRKRNLSAREQVQKSVLSWFNLDSIEAGSVVEVSMDGSSGGIAAYLSVVDSNSTDPSYRMAVPLYGESVPPEMIDESVMATTYALSTAVDHSGPKVFGKTTAECIDTHYDGDTLRPGESPEGKCWQAEVVFNNCEWTLPAYGDEFFIDGHSNADVCVTDGRENTFDTDISVSYYDAHLGETHRTDIDAEQTITMHFDGSTLASTALIGSSLLSYDGESIRMESDLVWEDGLAGLEFIPSGIMHLYFPYETGHGSTTGEALAQFDGTEWVLITLKLGYYQVSYYVNIYTGEVRVI